MESQDKTHFQVIVCGAIHNKNDNRFLVGKRGVNQIMEGFWEFPGGKLEWGENLEQALHREISEELNITITIEKLCHVKAHHYPHKAVLILLYECLLVSGTPELIAHSELKWVTPNEMDDLIFLPANKELIDKLKTL